jgi:hypothetical protein
MRKEISVATDVHNRQQKEASAFKEESQKIELALKKELQVSQRLTSKTRKFVSLMHQTLLPLAI